MNHKRRRPKHQRAGCLLCKPHKDERKKKQPRSKREQVESAIEEFSKDPRH
jgi:hypothetical protein